jgi:hypothetical protein
MFVAPGPTELVQAQVCNRFFILAKAPNEWKVDISQSQARPGFLERLTEPCHIAMPEDAKCTRDQALAHAIALAVLDGKKLDRCLGDGQAASGHRGSSLIWNC